MKAKIKYYVALIVALLGAVFVFLFQRRGEKITDLQDKLTAQKIGDELASITEQSKKSSLDYEIAAKRYADLKRAHPEYFKSGPQG